MRPAPGSHAHVGEAAMNADESFALESGFTSESRRSADPSHLGATEGIVSPAAGGLLRVQSPAGHTGALLLPGAPSAGADARTTPVPGAASLTAAQRRCAEPLVYGWSTIRIARHVHLTPEGVTSQLKALRRALGLSGTTRPVLVPATAASPTKPASP